MTDSEKLLSGKNAVITGAKGGIGRAMIKLFAQNGANVWACIRKQDSDFEIFCNQVSKENNVWVKIVCFDMANDEEIKQGAHEILLEKKSIDILVNNAGIASKGTVFMLPMKTLKESYQINFFSHVYLIQLLSKSMIRQKSGCIINISSAAAYYHFSGALSYGSSKAALMWMTECIAQEFAPFNIRCNGIAPGLIETSMGHFNDKEIVAQRVSKTAMGRMGDAKEVAELAVFLASSKSTYVNGTTIRIDGGGYGNR